MSDASNRLDNLHVRLNVLLGAGILVSAMVIYAAASGDLWLDEIWSIFFAEAAKSPWEIVSLYKHDNNHLLNTFYLYAIGRQDTLIFYRLLSMAAGIGSIYLLTRIARKRGDLESIFVLLLAGLSYPLILYFSEARGYGPAIFFALLSLFLLEECSANYSTMKLFSFWLALCLGLMSHLSSVIVFLSLSILVIHKEVLGPSSLRSKLQHCFKYLFMPFLFLAFFYLYYARGMTIGGGDINNPFAEISRGIAYLLGLPRGALFLKMAAYYIFTVITLIGAYLCYRDKNNLWSFFIAVIVLPPVVIIFLTRPTVYYFRYLVVTFPFFYLLLSSLLGRLYRRGGKYSCIALVVLCLYLVGQTQYLLPLLRDGRGNYQAILREISEKSEGNVLKVGSDHDFRNRMLLSFYQRFLPSQQTLQYIEQSRWNVESPEWMITHSTGASFEPNSFISISDQRVYGLTRSERFSGNSGFGWFLYHRINPGRTF